MNTLRNWEAGRREILCPIMLEMALTHLEQREKAMNTAERIVDVLNAYKGDNIWQDAIYPTARRLGTNVDQDATQREDPHYRSDVAVFQDGSSVQYDAQGGVWVAYNA